MATCLQPISGIYKIINIINGKMYVGCASNIRTRINGHLYNLRKGNHQNNYLQKAWNKYGEKNFIFEIIEQCSIDDLHLKEHYWIGELDCLNKNFGYNLKPTNPNGKSLHSKETIEKIKEYHKKNNIKPTAQCYAAGQLYNNSELCKINLAKAREKLKNVDFNIVNAPKRKKVINVETGQIYESLRIAAEIYGIPKQRLSKYLLGKRTNKTNLKYL